MAVGLLQAGVKVFQDSCTAPNRPEELVELKCLWTPICTIGRGMLGDAALLCAAQVSSACEMRIYLIFRPVVPIPSFITQEESAHDRSMHAHGHRAAVKACCR